MPLDPSAQKAALQQDLSAFQRKMLEMMGQKKQDVEKKVSWCSFL